MGIKLTLPALLLTAAVPLACTSQTGESLEAAYIVKGEELTRVAPGELEQLAVREDIVGFEFEVEDEDGEKRQELRQIDGSLLQILHTAVKNENVFDRTTLRLTYRSSSNEIIADVKLVDTDGQPGYEIVHALGDVGKIPGFAEVGEAWLTIGKVARDQVMKLESDGTKKAYDMASGDPVD